MINSIKAFGKFLDQPMLIAKLNKCMPKIVSSGAIAYLGYDYFSKKDNAKTVTQKRDIKQEWISSVI